MSKRDRAAAERQAAESAELRAALAEQDARWEARAEQDRQRNQQLLAEARQQFAQDRLETEAASLETYRQQVVAQVLSSKAVAPQLATFITGSSKEEIDAKVEAAKASTAEILAEISGQTTTTPAADQPRDELGRFAAQPQQGVPARQYLPQGMNADEYAKIQAGTYSLEDHARMRDRLGLGHRDAGLFN